MNDLPSQTVLQQNAARPMSGSELEVLGKKASAQYLAGCSPNLTEAVVETVKRAGLSPEQVKRVVEFANTDAYLKEFEKKGATHKYIDFEGGPANPAEVIKDLNDGGGGTIFDRGDGDYALAPTLGKTAAAIYQGNLEAMEKVADWKKNLAIGAGTAAGVGGATLLAVGKKGREQMKKELHDPRLYSNLRGMATLESREKRVAAHKGLKKGEHSVLGAMKEGFTRGGKDKKASVDFNPAETAFEQMWEVEDPPLPYAEPLADSLDMRDKLAAATDHFRAEIDILESNYLDTVEDLYGQVKQAALGGVPLGHILQAWATVVPGDGFVKVAFAHIGKRLLQDGVFEGVEEYGDSLEKVASSGMVDTTHPLVTNFAAFCLNLEKLAEARAAQEEIEVNLHEVTDFLKHADRVQDLIQAGGAIPKAVRSVWGGAGTVGQKLKKPVGAALGALGGPGAQRVGEAVGEYGPKALLAAGALGLGESAYQKAVKHGPLGGVASILRSRMPGTQEYYIRQSALAQNPGLF